MCGTGSGEIPLPSEVSTPSDGLFHPLRNHPFHPNGGSFSSLSVEARKRRLADTPGTSSGPCPWRPARSACLDVALVPPSRVSPCSPIGFTAHGRTIRIEVPLPDPQRPPLRPSESRGAKAVQAALEQEERRIWRAVRLWIFGQLEAIRSGIRTFEIAFLSDVVLPSPRLSGRSRRDAALLPPRLSSGD